MACVCSCTPECGIRLNLGRRAGGELQVLSYARFTRRYVRVNVCVCVCVCVCVSERERERE